MRGVGQDMTRIFLCIALSLIRVCAYLPSILLDDDSVWRALGSSVCGPLCLCFGDGVWRTISVKFRYLLLLFYFKDRGAALPINLSAARPGSCYCFSFRTWRVPSVRLGLKHAWSKGPNTKTAQTDVPIARPVTPARPRRRSAG